MRIIGSVDENRLYCAGSFTKLLTTYVCLSLLAEQHDLTRILDDENFLDALCLNPQAKNFLGLFQTIIGNKFTLRDICTYYAGLPYTFDLAPDELSSVEHGDPFKHHSILDEETFLYRCHNKIIPVYKNRCKFHYSEVSIIFLGYLFEKIFNIQIEDLFQRYVINQFKLTQSQFARKRPKNVYTQDLSDKYDYPSIAILDHGYFCYSNGYYTTLHDMKILIGQLVHQPIFQHMVDIKHARAVSNRILNGLTIEIRIVGDDIIYGYEGLSFSGCNIWAYSTKQQEGYVTFTDSEEEAYDIYHAFGYTDFDIVPEYTQDIYKTFLKTYDNDTQAKDIPMEYQGNYHRVRINEKELDITFRVGNNFIVIRNPDEVKYDIVYANNAYRVKSKDQTASTSVGFSQGNGEDRYMIFDGTLYKKICNAHK